LDKDHVVQGCGCDAQWDQKLNPSGRCGYQIEGSDYQRQTMSNGKAGDEPQELFPF
jgi:hypothetical protein